MDEAVVAAAVVGVCAGLLAAMAAQVVSGLWHRHDFVDVAVHLSGETLLYCRRCADTVKLPRD